MNLTEKVQEWQRTQEILNAKKEALRKEAEALANDREAADDALVEMFMAAYRALPRQVRMKIRNAVNNEVMER